MIDQLEIRLDASLDVGITELLGKTLLVNLAGYLLPELGQVVLRIGVLDVSEQIGASPHEIVPAPQQVPGGSHLGRIDICHWDHAILTVREHEWHGKSLTIDKSLGEPV